MNKKYAGAFIVASYVALISIPVLGMILPNSISFFAFCLIPIAAIIGSVNFIYAIMMGINLKKKNIEIDHTEFLKIGHSIKMWMIPIFVINFLMWFIVLVLVPIGFVNVVFLPAGIALTYGVMMVGSSYMMMYLWNEMTKEGNNDKIVLHIILQLFFVLDVIDAIYLYRRWKKLG